MRPPQNSVGLARVAVVTTATTTATMSMATQAPAGGGAMMAMPSAAMMMPTMPQPTGGGGGGPAGPALQANASLGLFSAADNGLAQDEVAIGIDLGGEWVRASVWDAEQKRVVALDLDGFGGPLRAVVAFPRPSAPVVGEAALGAAAPQHTLVGAKRLLGRKYTNPTDAAWLDSDEGAGLHTCALVAGEEEEGG